MRSSFRFGAFARKHWLPLLLLDGLVMVVTGWAMGFWHAEDSPGRQVLGFVLVVEMLLMVVLLARIVYLLPGNRGAGRVDR
jgi:hypothetical protein